MCAIVATSRFHTTGAAGTAPLGALRTVAGTAPDTRRFSVPIGDAPVTKRAPNPACAADKYGFQCVERLLSLFY